MDTLKNIEERIKFKNIIIKFKKYLNNLDTDDRVSIITDINMWINVYKKLNELNSKNSDFYNHISNISKIYNSDIKSIIDIRQKNFWSNLFLYIEIKECQEFIIFLDNISK
jgi:hypothetical protein